MAFFEGRGVGLGFLFLQTLIRSLCFVWHHVGLASQMSRPVNMGEYQFAVSVSKFKDNISTVNFIDARVIHTKNCILGMDDPYTYPIFQGLQGFNGFIHSPQEPKLPVSSHVRLKTIFLMYQITRQARTAFAKICPSLQYECVQRCWVTLWVTNNVVRP